MSDDELIRRGDAKLVVEHQDEGWHDGISGDYHPYTKAEFAKHIAQAIAALPAATPATSPGLDEGKDTIGITDCITPPTALDDPKVRKLVEAAKGLEWACEQLAATRTHEVYLAMIDSGQSDALLSLDARRHAIRAALRDMEGA